MLEQQGVPSNVAVIVARYERRRPLSLPTPHLRHISRAALDRASPQETIDFSNSLIFRDTNHQCDFPAEAVDGNQEKVPFAETLAGIVRSEKIASRLRKRKYLSGVNFA